MATYSQATGYELKTANGTVNAGTRSDIIVPGTNEWAFVAGLFCENAGGGPSNLNYEIFRIQSRITWTDGYDQILASVDAIQWHDFFSDSPEDEISFGGGGGGATVLSRPARTIRSGEKMALNNPGGLNLRYRIFYYHFKNNVQI